MANLGFRVYFLGAIRYNGDIPCTGNIVRLRNKGGFFLQSLPPGEGIEPGVNFLLLQHTIGGFAEEKESIYDKDHRLSYPSVFG